MSELSNPNDIHSLGTELWESLDFSVFQKNLLKSRNTARLDIDKLVRSLPGWSEPTYNIVNANSDMCIDIRSRGYDGDHISQQTCGNAEADQQFRLEPVGDYYKLIADESGQALVVAGASSSDGADVYQWRYDGSDNHLWELRPAEQGYELVAKHSGKCMDVAGASLDSGIDILQWDCHGGANQQWQIVVSQ